MARPVLLGISILGLLFAAVSLVGMATDILRAQDVDWNGWTVQLRDEVRNGNTTSGSQDNLPVLYLPYFAIAAGLFLTVALFGHRWLASPHRRLWFALCAFLTLGLCLIGMPAGTVLFGPMLIAFVWFAVAEKRPTTDTSHAEVAKFR
jgi:hypothetical protein